MNLVSDRSILDNFTIDFITILQKYSEYMVVSGFLAIASGRTRGTEDIDLIVKKMSLGIFKKFFNDLYSNNFECIQDDDPKDIYNLYLKNNETIRFVRKGTFAPDMEFKFS